MSVERVVRVAKPTHKQWHQYKKLFSRKPNVVRILELLEIRNELEVKRCIKLFSDDTIRITNSGFRRSDIESARRMRILACPETLDKPLSEQTIHLYEIEIVSTKTPA